ncbi:MAG: hypothetical protein U0J50_02085, partial [Peptacetobacter hiranonis]|nr:hypothetical protein [Peptacetobacter hiranonis]
IKSLANFKKTGGEEMSSIELIKVINEAEEQADKIKKDGVQEAKQIVADANKRASQLILEAEDKADAEYNLAISKAEEEAGKVYDDTIEQTSEKSRVILSEAEKNIQAGVKVVLERIVKSNVNC